jgi:hypothetical protein
MKTYTLTWKSFKWQNKSSISRFRVPFIPDSSLTGVIGYFLDFATGKYNNFTFVGVRPSCWRLSSCGRLVARSATYQGV